MILSVTAKERLEELIEALPEERAAELCALLERDETLARAALQKDPLALLSILDSVQAEPDEHWPVSDFLTALASDRLSFAVPSRD
jgi:hypothetical protein